MSLHGCGGSHLSTAGQSKCICEGQQGQYVHPYRFRPRPLLNCLDSGRAWQVASYQIVEKSMFCTNMCTQLFYLSAKNGMYYVITHDGLLACLSGAELCYLKVCSATMSSAVHQNHVTRFNVILKVKCDKTAFLFLTLLLVAGI